MMARTTVIFLLISAVVGVQELDEASCANAPVKSDRSLIQYHKASATPMQLAENTGNQELARDFLPSFVNGHEEETVDGVKIAELFAEVLEQGLAEEEQEAALANTATFANTITITEAPENQPTGKAEEDVQNLTQHSVEFARGSEEMKSLVTQMYSDFSNTTAGNVSKEYLLIDFPNAGEQAETVIDKVMMFGFTAGTAGLKSVNANRIFTKDPTKKGSKLAHVIMVSAVSEEWGKGEWNYHVEFAKPPPECLKLFPENGKVEQMNGNLVIVMTCDDAMLCKDGKVIISAVQFTPQKKGGKKVEVKIGESVGDPKASKASKASKLLNTDWTGQMVDVELADTAPDMKGAVEKTFFDYPAIDNASIALKTPNVSKPYLEVSFPVGDASGQIVENESTDKILMFGFKRGTTGLTNVNANRIWSKRPGSKGAMLVYGFTMLAVPGKKPWKYSIEYSITPPGSDVFKVYPKGGKVAQVGNKLVVVMTCSDEDLCKDKKINVAAVQFKPAGDTMNSPEKIIPKQEAFVVRQDPVAQQAGSMFDQVLGHEQAAKQEDIGAAQAAELFSQASSQALKEDRADWTGNIIDVEFGKTAPDMKNVAPLMYNDFAGPNLTGNVSKPYMEINYVQTEGAQIVSNASKDKIRMFGFEKGTSGIRNVVANRIWSGNPAKKTSKLVYGIIMDGAEKAGTWRYHVEFLQPPPSIKFKIFPEGGQVAQKDGKLFITMTCDEPPEETECDDGNIIISAVQFRRADKKEIKKPEEVLTVTTTKPR